MIKRITILAFLFLVTCSAILSQNVSPTTEPDADDPGEVLFMGEDTGSTPTLAELLRKGGGLMYPLYIASFIMIAFGIERSVSLQRKRILPPDVVGRIRAVTDKKHGTLDVKELLEDIRAEDSPIVRVVRAGLRKAYRPTMEIEKAIEDAGAKEASTMRRNCRALSVVANVAPLLGLLGTVLGMINAFMTVASKQEALGKTELLAAGIYQALVTTAVGLAIAIPSLILYYLFVDKIERLINEIDDITIELVERMTSSKDAPGEV